MNYIKRLLGLDTVDGILGDFNKVINRLHAHATRKGREVDKHDALLAVIRDRKFAAQNEVNRAHVIAGKFIDLTCTNDALKAA